MAIFSQVHLHALSFERRFIKVFFAWVPLEGYHDLAREQNWVVLGSLFSVFILFICFHLFIFYLKNHWWSTRFSIPFLDLNLRILFFLEKSND